MEINVENTDLESSVLVFDMFLRDFQRHDDNNNWFNKYLTYLLINIYN